MDEMRYKRKKPRRKVKCDMCTDARAGNSASQDRKQDKVGKQHIEEAKDEIIDRKTSSS